MKKALLSLLMVAAFLPFANAQEKVARTIVSFNKSACESYTWAVNGQTYTNDTIALYVCPTNDTLYVLNLTVNTPSVSNETIVSDRCTYNWRGIVRDHTGLYTDTVFATTESGLCDSVFNAMISVSNTEINYNYASACGSYVWNGDTLTTSDLYADTTVTGDTYLCNHVEQLQLAIVTTLPVSETVNHCGDYMWYGTSYNVSGTYTHTVSNEEVGCDTLHTLHLNIVVDTMPIVNDSACDSKVWRGVTYNATGLYAVNETDANNCVTHHRLNLKIKDLRRPEKDTAMVGCNSVLFTVSSLAGSTVKRFVVDTLFDTNLVDRRWARCYDSVIHLNVTVHKSGYDTTYANACDSFYWNLNKKTYYKTPETNPSYAFATDEFGCDSMMTLVLNVKKTPVISAINGEWYLNAGETAKLYPTCTEGASYKWTYAGNTSTADTLIINNVQGNIDVTLEATLNYPANSFACHDTSWITLVTFVGIDGVENSNVSLYPNPCVGQLNIESADAVRDIVVFNTLGQQVAFKQNIGFKSVMDLTSLAKGTYTMRLTFENGTSVVRKFIITK